MSEAGIVTDEHCGETDLPELAHLLGDLAADALGERLAVHQRAGTTEKAARRR